MTACIALRKDVYYVRLTYYDFKRQRKDKWVSTGLSGKEAKRKAEAMIDSFIEKYNLLSQINFCLKNELRTSFKLISRKQELVSSYVKLLHS